MPALDPIKVRVDGPRRPRSTFVLAHGAGADMDSQFMAYFAVELAQRGFRVVRFDFPYMQARRRTGRKRPPDREATLRATWLQVIEQVRTRRLIIGGKSMGGRIASLLADDADVSGLVCLGYPFHPLGKPDRLRVAHLHELATPTLIVQGERDAFGNRNEVASFHLPAELQFSWLPDGDHSFKPRKISGRTELENWADAVNAIAGFAERLAAES